MRFHSKCLVETGISFFAVINIYCKKSKQLHLARISRRWAASQYLLFSSISLLLIAVKCFPVIGFTHNVQGRLCYFFNYHCISHKWNISSWFWWLLFLLLPNFHVLTSLLHVFVRPRFLFGLSLFLFSYVHFPLFLLFLLFWCWNWFDRFRELWPWHPHLKHEKIQANTSIIRSRLRL